MRRGSKPRRTIDWALATLLVGALVVRSASPAAAAVSEAPAPASEAPEPVSEPPAPLSETPAPANEPSAPANEPPALVNEPPAPLGGGAAAPEGRPPTVAYVVVGLAGAAAVVGALFGVKALREKNDFDNGDRTTVRVESIEKNALLADMAFGAALTLGVTGVFLWLSRQEGPAGISMRVPRRPAVVVAPLVSASAPGATAMFHF